MLKPLKDYTFEELDEARKYLDRFKKNYEKNTAHKSERESVKSTKKAVDEAIEAIEAAIGDRLLYKIRKLEDDLNSEIKKNGYTSNAEEISRKLEKEFRDIFLQT